MSDHTQSTSSNRRKLLLRLSWASSHLTPIWTGPRRAGKLKALTALLSSLTLLSSPLPLLTHSKVHRPGPSRPSPVRRLRFGALGHCWLRGRQLGTGTCTTHSFLFGTPEGHASRAQARIHHLCHHSPANSELWPQSRRRAHLRAPVHVLTSSPCKEPAARAPESSATAIHGGQDTLPYVAKPKAASIPAREWSPSELP